jgi:hypothetical protein
VVKVTREQNTEILNVKVGGSIVTNSYHYTLKS